MTPFLVLYVVPQGQIQPLGESLPILRLLDRHAWRIRVAAQTDEEHTHVGPRRRRVPPPILGGPLLGNLLGKRSWRRRHASGLVEDLVPLQLITILNNQ
jgi:hypothetical protein